MLRLSFEALAVVADRVIILLVLCTISSTLLPFAPSIDLFALLPSVVDFVSVCCRSIVDFDSVYRRSLLIFSVITSIAAIFIGLEKARNMRTCLTGYGKKWTTRVRLGYSSLDRFPGATR